MLKFGKRSWHRRVITWGLGREYLEWKDWNDTNDGLIWKEKKNVNLCPYMRALIGVILISPWIGLWKILPKYCTFDHPDMTKIFLIVGSICATIHILFAGTGVFEWWWMLAGTAIMAIVISGFVGLIFGVMALKDWMDDRPVREHKPNLLREYMNAKHNKVCPQIEFE